MYVRTLATTKAAKAVANQTYRSQNEVDVAAQQLRNELSFSCLHKVVAFSVVTKVQSEAVSGGGPAAHTGQLPPLEDLGERWRDECGRVKGYDGVAV